MHTEFNLLSIQDISSLFLFTFVHNQQQEGIISIIKFVQVSINIALKATKITGVTLPIELIAILPPHFKHGKAIKVLKKHVREILLKGYYLLSL